MKVILLAPTPPPAGGIAGWTLRMKRATLRNNWEVEVVDEKVIGNREVFGSKNKINFFIEIKRTLIIWFNLFKSLRNPNVKVVHACIPGSTPGMLREIICALITKVSKRKFIIHYRSTLPNIKKGRFWLEIFKILTNLSDLVVALNNISVDFITEHSATPVELIPNFIEENEIKKSEINTSKKIKRVLYVGGVIESKGCKEIIEVAKSFPDIEFRLVGKPSDEIKGAKKTSNVVICGEKNKQEVEEELIKADLFMFLTYFPGEGFSNALAEAMANGLPCIVSDWAANKDMIEDKGGVVVPIKSSIAAVDALKKLDTDWELRERQSIWNLNKVRNNYSAKIITDKYVNAYEKVIAH